LKLLAFIVACAALSLPLWAADSKPARSGEEIYRVYCGSCHGSGWQGAPIAYDEQEWKSRMTNGAAAMFANAKNGLNSMPAMGACMDCSDAELKAAIDEMLKF
jgi:cytochrome c5